MLAAIELYEELLRDEEGDDAAEAPPPTSAPPPQRPEPDVVVTPEEPTADAVSEVSREPEIAAQPDPEPETVTQPEPSTVRTVSLAREDRPAPEAPGARRPTPAPPPSGPTPWASILVLAVGAAILAAAIGVVVRVASPPPPAAGRIVAEARVDTSGGVIRFPSGRLEIPEGAVDQPRTITIRRFAAGEVEGLDGTEVVGPILSFEPGDLRFDPPARLVVRAPSGAEPVILVDGAPQSVPVEAGPGPRTVTILLRTFSFEDAVR